MINRTTRRVAPMALMVLLAVGSSNLGVALAEKESKADSVESDSLLRQALASAAKVDNPGHKAWLLLLIGKTQAKAGDTAGALRTFKDTVPAALAITDDRMHVPDLLMHIGEAQADLGQIEQAQETAKTIKEENNRDSLVGYVAVRLARDGKMKEALDKAKQIPLSYYRDGAFMRIVEVQAETGKIEEALATLRLIESSVEHPWTFGCVACALPDRPERLPERRKLAALGIFPLRFRIA